MNYERVVQWISGPFSVFIGGVTTKWVTSWHFLGALGLPTTGVARAITSAVVFLAASGVTYAGHHKWLTNAAKWWEHSGLTLPAGLSESAPPDATVTTDPHGTAAAAVGDAVIREATRSDTLRSQLRDAGITPEV